MNPHRPLKSATGGTIALNAFPQHLFAPETKKYATDRVKLGPRNVEVSRLAQGTGTGGVGGGSNQTRKLGMRGLADLFIAGYDNGLMLWDSARPVRHVVPHARSFESDRKLTVGGSGSRALQRVSSSSGFNSERGLFGARANESVR